MSAPASVIANNGGSIVSNNSSGLISNNSGSFRLLTAEAWQPASGVRLTVTDVFGRLVRGAEATTAADGSFGLLVPTEGTWIVRGHLGRIELLTLVRPTDRQGMVAVNPATTLTMQRLLKRYAQRQGSMNHVPLEAFDRMSAVLQASLEKTQASLDLSSEEKVEALLQHLEREDAAVAEAETALMELTEKAVEAVLAQGESTDEQLEEPPAVPPPSAVVPSPTPTPGPTPTPEPTSASTATPTPRPPLFDGKDCAYCDLEGADLAGRDLRLADLSHADLTQAGLAGADLRGANFEYANLRNADLTGATLEGATLKFADLRNAKLVGANLKRVDLSDAILTGANLTGSDLTGAQLNDAELSGAIWEDGRVCGPSSRGDCL